MLRVILTCLTAAWSAPGWAQAPALEELPPEQGEESPPAEETESQETTLAQTEHEVVRANTLWDLAEYYYNNPWLWPRIYEANKDKIKNPHWIYPGQVFVIPGLNKIVTVARKLPGQPASPAEPQESEPAPQEPEPPAKKPMEDNALADAFSKDLPPGLTGQRPAVYRLRFPRDWKPDGRVVEFKGREILAAQGDMVQVSLETPDVQKGQRYAVYRRASPTEIDSDEKATYVQRTGLVEIVRRISKKEYGALILNSGDGLQLDDLLKRE